jgi:hypothetical protein
MPPGDKVINRLAKPSFRHSVNGATKGNFWKHSQVLEDKEALKFPSEFVNNLNHIAWELKRREIDDASFANVRDWFNEKWKKALHMRKLFQRIDCSMLGLDPWGYPVHTHRHANNILSPTKRCILMVLKNFRRRCPFSSNIWQIVQHVKGICSFYNFRSVNIANK